MKEFYLAVADYLKNLGISMEMSHRIILAVSSSKLLIGKFLLYLDDNNPNEEQIMHWIVEHT